MATGVFSLRKVYIKQYQNVDNKNFASWPESATYGYYAGAFNPNRQNTIYRLDFSNESISLPGKNLPPSGVTDAAIIVNSSSSYGYFGGGNTGPPTVNTIRRFDFSNETISLPGNNLSRTRMRMGELSGNSYGYFAGGMDTTTPNLYDSVISRLDFSSETVSDPGKNLSQAISFMGSISTPNYGYFGGGYFPANRSTVTRFDFSTENVSNPGKNLSFGTSGIKSVKNTSYGYFAVAGAPSQAVERLDFATENISNPGKAYPVVIGNGSGTVSGVSAISYGYFAGGWSPALPGSICTVVRLDFETENFSTTGKNLPQVATNLGGFQGGSSIFRPLGGGSKTYGYFAGGFAPGFVSTITRLDFSTENLSNPGKNLPTAMGAQSYGLSNNSYGYVMGGSNPSIISTVQRLDFSNEVVNNPGNNLPSARGTFGTISSNNYGYIGGGNFNPPPTAYNTIIRLEYSNETMSLPGKNLTSLDNYLTGSSSNSYGYFLGGGTFSMTSRLDFSNEIVSDPGKNLLPAQKYTFTSMSNNSYGYFGGGYLPSTYVSTVTRLDFSNETISAPGKNIPAERSNQIAMSSAFYGYMGGGATGPVFSSTYLNTITRLDFSTESFSDPGKNLLESSRNWGTGLSNSN